MLTVNIEAFLTRSYQFSQFDSNVFVKIVGCESLQSEGNNHGHTGYDPKITRAWIGLCPLAQLISCDLGTLCISKQHFKKFSDCPDGVLLLALKTEGMFIPDWLRRGSALFVRDVFLCPVLNAFLHLNPK